MAYPIHFAPLQGYTDAVYRRVHAAVFGGVEAYYTPFVRLEKDGFRNKELRDISPEANIGVPVIPQLIAATPDEFRRIASLFEEQGYQQADINLGCPFPMQTRLHRGAGLLPYPDEVAWLLTTIYEFPSLSFSVKLRLGWSEADEALALLPLLHSFPLSHVTMHPRIGIQQYKGCIDREGFLRFSETCRLPLFYNGDLQTVADIHSVTVQFPHLQGVMLGRGLLATPWLAFEYITGKALSTAEKQERLRTFHSLLSEQYRIRLEGGEHQLTDKMKTLWEYLLPDAEKKLRKKVLKSTSFSAYTQAVADLIHLSF